MNLADIVRSFLIYKIVQPIAKQQVGMSSPSNQWLFGGIVIGVIIAGSSDVQPFVQISDIFLMQGFGCVLRMAFT
jgi:hypothetical protein